MGQQYRIAIAGIGGVGGFYGASLARTYQHSTEIIINFVARGDHMLAIRQRGLQLDKDSESIIAAPHFVTDTPKELGHLDLIVFCCKAYDLKEMAQSFSNNITDKTVLLPLLNGVDSVDTLQQLYPHAKTLYGCTYLFVKRASNGVIKMTGDLNQLLFGGDSVDKTELNKIKQIFSKSGVNVDVYDDIKTKLWEKYCYVSPNATATSALNSSLLEIMEDDGKRNTLRRLMEEATMLATAKGYHLPADLIDTNLEKLTKVPREATSSMHNDFKANNKTELEVLTGYVVREGKKSGIDTPTYDELYSVMLSTSSKI